MVNEDVTMRSNAPVAGRLAWGILGGIVVGAVTLVVRVAVGARVAADSGSPPVDAVSAVLLGIVGATIVSRRHGNVIGWLFLAAASLYLITPVVETFAFGSHPPTGVMLWTIWAGAQLWLPAFAISLIFLPLLFPTGHLLARSWRWAPRVAVPGMILFTMGNAFHPDTFDGFGFANPAALPGSAQALEVIATIGMLLLFASAISAVVALVKRYRRSRGHERLQMKWFVFAAVVSLVASFANGVLYEATDGASGGVLSGIGFALLPIAAGVAILKHRLYDIDVVINKTLVYATLAAFVTATYVAVVVGAGSLLQARNDLLLSVTATVVVAFAFQPVRRSAQHVANRWVYGERATPYEVLANLSESIAHTGEPTEVLRNMLVTFARATGAARAAVLSGTTALATFPAGDATTDHDHRFPIVDRGDELGTLALSKPANEPLRDEEADLARYLAGQAGLLLRNHRLNLGLLADLEALRVSRQRLVRAQDEERMRLEQELRASTQPALAAARETAARLASAADSEQVRDLLVGVGDAAADAMATVTELARGMYPATLEAEGVGPALRAQAARATVPLHVDDDGQRFPREVEAALYFCALEAIQNAMKYAHATQITVEVRREGDRARLSVRDDGIGFDAAGVATGTGTRNMGDRLGAIGGTVSIASAPGEGTSITGSVPLGAR